MNKKIYISLFAVLWTLLVTMTVNPVLIGSLYTKYNNYMIHNYNTICNLGINTNFLLVIILLIQTIMIYKDLYVKNTIKIVSGIIFIYTGSHLILNSLLNYKLKENLYRIGLFEYMLPVYIAQILILKN